MSGSAQDDRAEVRSQLAKLRSDDEEKSAPVAWWIVTVLGLAIVIGLGFKWVGDRPSPRNVVSPSPGAPSPAPVVEPAAVVASPQASKREGVLSGTGYVVSGDRYVSVGAIVPGRIAEYVVEEGDRVEKGSVLVRLDAREYEAAVRRAAAELELAQANVGLAEAERSRGRMLHASDILSRHELDVLENRAMVAIATRGRARAELERARLYLEHTELRSPTAGVVLAKLKERGEIAVPGGFSGSGDLVRIANLDDLRVEVDVNEAELARVRLGGPARIASEARPNVYYEANVAKIYPQVDRGRGTVRVEVSILEPDSRLLPDMSARVDFLADDPEAE